MLQHDEAIALGFAFTALNEFVELGTSAISKVERATGNIGTGLRRDCLLLVDFLSRLVEIETQH
jgi:hypothetical protein